MSKRHNIKKIAIELVKKNGLINLSRKELCDTSGIPDGSFAHVMGCTFTIFLEELQSEVDDTHEPKARKKRVAPEIRKNHLLNVAVKLSLSKGYNHITRLEIAEAAGVSCGLINVHFGTMPQLRGDIMRAAIKREILPIIQQGWAVRDARALKISPELRIKVDNYRAGV